MIKRNRSKETVMWKAIRRAVGLMVFEISHRINSARTAASAMVVEKAIAETRLIWGRPWLPMLSVDDDRAWPFFGGVCASRLLDGISPERIGNSFWRTTVETKRKVTRNGSEEKIMAVGACIRRPGTQPSQSPVMETIDAPHKTEDRIDSSVMCLGGLELNKDDDDDD